MVDDSAAVGSHLAIRNVTRGAPHPRGSRNETNVASGIGFQAENGLGVIHGFGSVVRSIVFCGPHMWEKEEKVGVAAEPLAAGAVRITCRRLQALCSPKACQGPPAHDSGNAHPEGSGLMPTSGSRGTTKVALLTSISPSTPSSQMEYHYGDYRDARCTRLYSQPHRPCLAHLHTSCNPLQ
ncbi:hypothetical protein BCR34DRAFT_586726 [Clohesyomyces aquaticus]|uniref:Uncharacterized protein n=1 Tax=Clohesyomyces aquaticus TaxID=1231657 RepID=A0A1Y1ZSL6_9PLEO|nr:hypothetical protein BCR34DRAFT_586726 [Clohesyomyces aquaticus]